jgi:leucyl/phenylalanyl-tRNA--protein transferase
LRQAKAEIRFNQAFDEVIRKCAEPRISQQGTWITTDMISAYGQLYEEGWAHSVETWLDGALVGGLYGLAIGNIFFGESMFSRKDNASKYALYALSNHLHEQGFELIDCQVASQHLLTLGATMMPRHEFSSILKSGCESPTRFSGWPDSPLPVTEIAAKQAPAALQ